WGETTVESVINRITRSAKAIQGTLVTGGGGSEDRGFAGVRFGDKIGENLFFRGYGTYYKRADSDLLTGAEAHDGWQIGRFGFRADWDVAPGQDLITVQGDAYRGSEDQVFNVFDPSSGPTLTRTVRDNITVDGGNLLGRWSHQFTPGSELNVQLYYDRTERDTVIFKEKRDTFTLGAI